MWRFAILATLLLIAGCGGSSQKPQTPIASSPPSSYGPKLTLHEHLRAMPDESERIKALIGKLAGIENIDSGLSSTMSDHSFLPVFGRTTRHGFRLRTDHRIIPADPLCELVRLGPKALPFLLAALDDKLPTQLTIEHSGGFGAMWFANELWGNPTSKHEQSALKARVRPKDRFPKKYIDSYTVKVGDVCFVAIGQIVGRGYQAVRYQPTSCIVVNSPTNDAQLCEQVRAIWSSDDPHRKLLDSLLLDFSTQGKFNGVSLDGWDIASQLQIEAAVRLHYYFPREGVPLIAKRLKSLKVYRTGPLKEFPASPDELTAYMNREVENGVRADELIAAVKWSDDPIIQDAIADIRRRTDDPNILKVVGSSR